MATVTKSIGTSSRDYSTIALWEADLDESSIYSSGDTAVGECYNDTTFSISGSTDIDGGSTIGLDNRILTAAAGEWRPQACFSAAQSPARAKRS